MFSAVNTFMLSILTCGTRGLLWLFRSVPYQAYLAIKKQSFFPQDTHFYSDLEVIPISYQLSVIYFVHRQFMARRWGGLGTGISFIHEKTERSQASGEDHLTFLSLFGTYVLVLGLDDLDDGSPRRDVLGRPPLRDLVGEVVGPRPEVVSDANETSPRHDVLGRVRERDLGLDGVDDDGFGLLSGTPLSAIFGLERSLESQGTWRVKREPRSGSLFVECGYIAKRCIRGSYNDGPLPGAEVSK